MIVLRAIAFLILLAGAAVLHWSLPFHDVVRVVGTEVARETVTSGSGDRAESVSRDIRFINTITPSGRTRVYRNTDTGWGWPPYFKFASADLAARATNLVSTEADPRWVVLTHYGWRLPFISAFPNAIAIREASGPGESVVPWFSIVMAVLVVLILLLLRRRVLALFGR